MPTRGKRLASLAQRSAALARGRGAGRRRLLVALTAVACVAVAVVVAHDWAATLDATDRTRAQQEAASDTLAQTEDDLAATLLAADADRQALAAGAAALSVHHAERADAQGTLDATQLWLAALQAQLATATTDLEASTDRLAALQACLAGAAQALNQAAARDTFGSAATVRDIEASCTEAGVEL